MFEHPFLFSPGKWLGEGRVTFSVSTEEIKFFTRWDVSKPDSFGNIFCQQRIEMHGLSNEVQNNFVLSGIETGCFVIELTNEDVGTVKGKGTITEKNIAWEFRGHPEMQGVEVYEKLSDDRYRFHAEYAATEQYRTVIEGFVWKA